MNFKSIIIPVLILLIPCTLFSWQPYEKVLAVVNNRAITESDVNLKFERLRQFKKISPSKISYEKSRILDNMIEAELIFETAQKESILIPDKRIINQLEGAIKRFFSNKVKNVKELSDITEKVSENLEKLMKNKFDPDFKIDPDLKKFIDFIEKKEKLDFFTFFEELKVNIAREQVMSIAIGSNPPSQAEAKKWFNTNRGKLGYEVHVKHILIIPAGTSLGDEKKANDRAEELRKQIIANPGSFESIAAKYSQDKVSAKDGGDLGWQMLGQFDPFFAGNVHKLSKSGQISNVFKSGFGYHVVKYLGRRPVTYEKVEKLIMFRLYTENSQVLYKKWIKKKKEEASIKIYMDGYIKG